MKITVVIKPINGTWDEAEKIIKKICETYDNGFCTLHIVVTGVYA